METKNLPKQVSFFHALEMEIPIIFGVDRFEQTEDNTTTIGLDLFASTFFMLTRWEEYALGRENSEVSQKTLCQVDEESLFCVKNGLTERALIHEYESFLRILFEKYELVITNKREFCIKLTHDVDGLGAQSLKDIIVEGVSYLKEGKYKRVYHFLKKNIVFYLFITNQSRMFSKYIEISKQFGLSDSYLLKCCRSGEEECTYDIYKHRAQKVIEFVKKNAIEWGFHPSQSTFNNNNQFKEEFNRLLNTVIQSPFIGRNHRLIYNSNTIFQWESISIPLISNCGYQKRPGFRCGITIPFPIFNIYTRKQVNLKELPFVIMDSSLTRQNKNSEFLKESIDRIVQITSENKGVICVNWHVKTVSKWKFNKMIKLYKEVLKKSVDLGAKDMSYDGL